MKALMMVCVCMAVSQVTHGQTYNYGRTLDQTVQKLLRGTWDGWDEKQLRRAGDATAVALTKVIAGKDLSRTEIEITLDILDASFAEMTWVGSPSDREPRTTLFVLRYLDCATQDVALKGKIAAARKHILEEVAKPAKPE